MDRYFDTPIKRRCAFLLVVSVMMILAAIQTFIIGVSLGQLDDYQKLFALLKTDILSLSFISRLIYAIISQASFSIQTLMMAFFQSLRFFEVVLITILLIFIVSKFDKMKCQLWIWGGIISFLMVLFGCIFAVVSGYQAQSLQGVIQSLQWIGYLFTIQSVFQIGCCFIGIYQCIHNHYLPAMAITVQYMEEE